MTHAQQIEDPTLEADLLRLEDHLQKEGVIQGRSPEERRHETVRVLLALAGGPSGGIDMARAQRALERAKKQ